MKTGAILLAAGSGTRMGGTNKMLRLLNQKTVLEHSFEALYTCDQIDCIVITVSAETQKEAARLVEKALNKTCIFILGGSSRGESVYNALQEDTLWDCDIIAVHDGARCLVSQEILTHSIQDALKYGSGVVGIPSTDTMKVVNSFGEIEEHIAQRDLIWRAQTPQTFRSDWLQEAYKIGREHAFPATDDAQLVSSYLHGSDQKVHMTLGDENNIKLTTEYDVIVAQAILSCRDETNDAQSHSITKVGFGEDVHALAIGEKLILGGILIPYQSGLLGHSDADVVTHAIIDALLGAVAWGDIGTWFPDTDMQYKGAASLSLLAVVVRELKLYQQRIDWIDVTILAQAPKLAPYIQAMRQMLANTLEIDVQCISLKATTTEKLGFVGREEGIACRAVATVHGAVIIHSNEMMRGD